MIRKTYLTLALLAITFASVDTVNADVVYTAKDDFTFTDPNWSFDGGTFTIMSGFTGDITTANVSSVITGWDLSFTMPSGSITLNQLNSTMTYSNGVATNLTVTPTALVWPNTSNPGPGADALEFFENLGPGLIRYAAADGPGGAANLLLENTDTFSSTSSGDSAAVGTPVTIASTSVPEPNAFLCLSLIGTAGVGIRWSRNRLTQI